MPDARESASHRRIGRVLREERIRAGMTLAQLAAKVHCAPSSLRYYETGRKMPEDILTNAIRILNSPRLKYQKCYECSVCNWVMPWLDQVDTHPHTVLFVFERELQEALDAAREVRKLTTNKWGSEDMTKTEQTELGQAAEKFQNIRTTVDMLMGVLVQRFGIQMDTIGKRHYQKIVDRKYLRPQKMYS